VKALRVEKTVFSCGGRAPEEVLPPLRKKGFETEKFETDNRNSLEKFCLLIKKTNSRKDNTFWLRGCKKEVINLF
jgi:hypothetical protein